MSTTLNMANLQQHNRDVDTMSDAGQTVVSHQSMHETVMQQVADKIAEQEEVKRLKMKQPVCSIGWTIADTRCYMVTLQVFVLLACAFNLLVIYDEFAVEEANCVHDFGPYQDNAKTNSCGWPQNNVIIGTVAPVIGLIASVVIIISSFCLGSAVLKDMDVYNPERAAADRVSFSDMFSYYPLFRVIRKIVGWAAYLHFISFGLNLSSFYVGQHYLVTVLGVSSDEVKASRFIGVLVAALPVAILMRITHDSIWQRVFKHKFAISSNKAYQGADVQENNVNVSAQIANAVSNAFVPEQPRNPMAMHVNNGTQMSFAPYP